MTDINVIREKYKQLTNEQIIWLAQKESGDLTEEARVILLGEIETRQLNLKLDSLITTDIQLPVGELKKRISYLPCPNCGMQNELVGVKNRYVWSFLYLSEYALNVKIICSLCAIKTAWKYIAVSFFFGWWGKGLLMVPYSVFLNLINLFSIRRKSEEVIEHFLEEKKASILKDPQNDQLLLKLISEFNENNKLNYYYRK